jgi:hypothetical protein
MVLDENLLGLRLDNAIAAWYPGRVCSVTDLRSNTVIKDEAIPSATATFQRSHVRDHERSRLLETRVSSRSVLYRVHVPPQ